VRPAAFFDLDRTLLQVNSGRLWFRRERAAGRLSLRLALEAGARLGLYHAGIVGARQALARAVRTMAGQSEALLDARTREFYDEEIAQAYAPGGLAEVKLHQDAGVPVVLLTSASVYLSRLVQQRLALDGILCLRLEVEDGLFTGEIEDACYGDEKVSAAQRWADDNDVDLDSSWFYTDSFTDLPMLERVGRPRVVSPDPRLTRIARRRGWPILQWDGPTATSTDDDHA
jgi:HAD superfamily hydrolase (TIGR01490 family)